MTNRDSILITAEDLAAQLRAERDLPADAPRTRLLDVRWTLPQPDGRAAFAETHIPGAVYVDLDTELAEHKSPRDGRHPLPDPDHLQRAARSWGIREQDQVVAYDGGGNYASARVWWVLRNAGFARVRLLDGALPAWISAGFPVETGVPEVVTGDVTLGSGHLPVIDLDQVASFVAAGGALLDARAPERYQGLEEPVDPRAGHIPGALNAPTGENLDDSGRFRPADELRDRFAELGVDRTRSVGVYCGSGVTAAHNLVGLALAGLEGALFPGSWSQWSNHEELPVATGIDP
ncbi:sulfurtransferase [Leucobacter sp.]